jgi:hypothetical protein
MSLSVTHPQAPDAEVQPALPPVELSAERRRSRGAETL